MWQPVKGINTLLVELHLFRESPHEPATCTLPHPLSRATVWEKKLLSSVVSLWGYQSPPISWLLSTSISPLLSLSPTPSVFALFFTPCMNPALLLPRICIAIYLSLSPFSCPLLCASVVQSVYIHWPCPHYRHNTAAAGCLSHSHHCRFLTRPTRTHLTKWGREGETDTE